MSCMFKEDIMQRIEPENICLLLFKSTACCENSEMEVDVTNLEPVFQILFVIKSDDNL